MHDQSYYVHLESLNDFVRELETQIDGMSKPQDFLLTLTGQPLLFGEFSEAGSLTDAHNAAVTEMQGLLDQVRGAINFAQDVTTTVADGYEQADHAVAGDMNNAGHDDGFIGGIVNTVGGVVTTVLGGGQQKPGDGNG